MREPDYLCMSYSLYRLMPDRRFAAKFNDLEDALSAMEPLYKTMRGVAVEVWDNEGGVPIAGIGPTGRAWRRKLRERGF